MGFLVELGCKIMYFGGVLSLSAIAEELALPVSVAGDVMEFLTKERFAEMKKGSDIRASYTYALTDLGRERAREYLRFSGYVGAAPVTLGDYAAMARNQSIRTDDGQAQTMREAFEGVILAPGLHRPPRPRGQFRPVDLPVRPVRERQDVHRGAAGQGSERKCLHPARAVRGQPGDPRVRPREPHRDPYGTRGRTWRRPSRRSGRSTTDAGCPASARWWSPAGS